ncbi:MAG: ATP-binding protein [Bacteroidales bacterium]|nr:ATP-binding protein [Bacteroidales bacterium]
MVYFKNIFKGNLFGMPTSVQDDWKLNRLTLAFSGEIHQYEKAFREDYFYRSLNPMRFSLLLSLFFFGIFAFLDVLLLPELKNMFWIIRFGIISPLLTVVIIFSFSGVFKKYMQPVLAGIIYVTGLAIIVMTIFAANIAGNYTYYAGLFLIFIIGYTFIRARFIYATVVGWSIVATYEVAAIWISDTPIEILINNNFFFISANVIGMFISYFMEQSARRDFYMRILLQKEQEKVQTANNALEKRVQERTRQIALANKDLKKEIEIRKRHEKEKTKLEGQLVQLQKMETIGTLAGGIAHDFNNILTPIMGYTEMALEELSDDSLLRYDIEQINSAAIRGKDLVQQILTFSRQVDFDKKPLRLDVVITEVLKLIRASFPSNIEIRQDLDTECGTVMADSTQMHQIIMNLCTNAYHAMMGKGGLLTITLDKQIVGAWTVHDSAKIPKGTYLRLIISDTGHGMDKRTMERIFEPFFTKKEVGSGSGLGLSVVHGIVNNYHGTISVDSEPGIGTTFTIYLPQHSEKLEEEKDQIQGLKKGKGSILFVDDEKEITFMGKRMLESLGYTVDIKSDSQEALKAFSKNPYKYDLLVTDQAMPKILGTELIGRLKEIRADLKAIIITGYQDSIPASAMKQYGIANIITKPLILSEFSELIGKVLHQNHKKAS